MTMSQMSDTGQQSYVLLILVLVDKANYETN